MSINAAFNSYVEITESRRKELTDQINYNGKTYYYTAQSGTSMATPVVAGAIALWLQANPTLTTEQIMDVLAHTCTKPDPTLDYPNNTYGYGQIDVYKGLLYILDMQSNIPDLSTHQPKNVTFRLKDGRLFIEGAEDGTPIRIYTTDGRLVASAPLTQGSVRLPVGKPAGVYAVQVGTLGSTLIRTQ